jgi:aspartate/methionine/tyrosine aminotransferase
MLCIFRKTFSCTGWRVGFAIGPSALIHNIKTLHSVINFCTTTPFQKAVAKAFTIADEIGYFQWLPAMLQEKRDRLCAALDSVGMDYILPEGGYFVVVDVSKFFHKAGIVSASFSSLRADTPLHDRPDVQFSKWLVREIGVGPIPMSPFYTPEQRHLANNFIRLAYCKDDTTLDLAIDRLKTRLGSDRLPS